MPTTVTCEILIESCSPEGFFDLVYGNKTFLCQFHSDVNQDDNASVGDWEGGRRVLCFSIPSNAPAVLQRFIGSDRIAVVEQQVYQRRPDGSITLESHPAPQLALADKFSTTATMHIRQDPTNPDSCIVEGSVACKALGPYGLITTIESFMASEARASLTTFFDYCARYIEGLNQSGGLRERLNAAERGASPTTEDGHAVIQEMEEDVSRQESEFFDAPDVTLNEVMAAPGSVEGMVLCLQYLSKRGEQTEALMRSIDDRLLRIERDLQIRHNMTAQQLRHEGELASASKYRWLAVAGGVTAVATVAVWCSWGRRSQY